MSFAKIGNILNRFAMGAVAVCGCLYYAAAAYAALHAGLLGGAVFGALTALSLGVIAYKAATGKQVSWKSFVITAGLLVFARSAGLPEVPVFGHTPSQWVEYLPKPPVGA